MFMAGRKHDLNLKGAFMHMAADAGIALGVVVAGIAIYLTHWLWVDPVISLIIGVIIAISTWGLLRESINLSLAAVPQGIDPAAVETTFPNYLGSPKSTISTSGP
jgi:cobalt-zinc-cadmium efflux system protein